VPARWARGPAEAEVLPVHDVLHVSLSIVLPVIVAMLPLTKEGEVTTTVPNGNAAAASADSGAAASGAAAAAIVPDYVFRMTDRDTQA